MAHDPRTSSEADELDREGEAEVAPRASLSAWARAERRREEAAMSPIERLKLALHLGLMTLEFERRAKG